MPQTAESGAQADQWGRETARAIAARIDAIPVSDSSSEFARRGWLITIRCAHSSTPSVGVTHAMLKRVDFVMAAFEREAGEFALHEMSSSLYSALMRESPSDHRVGLVSREQFTRFAPHVQSVHL